MRLLTRLTGPEPECDLVATPWKYVWHTYFRSCRSPRRSAPRCAIEPGHGWPRPTTSDREREQLARELHDTVAHHVSAIAIRAQAGRALAPSRPEAAVDALEVIEEAASRTLVDLRALVGTLRDGDEAALAPQRGVLDVQRLAHGPRDGPRVDVQLTGDLDDLPPLVGAAIYRIAQESVTNAVRHASHATRIDVRVTGHDDCVRLIVRDDGDAVSSAPDRSSGYGLVGMSERAALLGGTLESGATDSGWMVTAELPRDGTAR